MKEANINIDNNIKQFNGLKRTKNLILSNINGLEDIDNINKDPNHLSNFKLKKDKEQLNQKKTYFKNILEEDKFNKKNIYIENGIKEEEENSNSYVKDILKEFLGRNSLIKRTYSMPDLFNNYSLETKIKNSIRPSIMPDKKSNINELNNLNEIIGIGVEKIDEDQNDIEDRMSIIKINDNLENNNTNTTNEKKKEVYEVEEEDDDYHKMNLRSKSFYKEKEMTNLYFEENEHKNSNITYSNTNNILNSISSNLLLKKIIFEDFLKKQANNIFHFCQQCFCFIKIDVFFGKILNCYKYYRKKNISLEKIANLIDFLNALIIEMFEYYKIIPPEYLPLIKNIYNYIISDLIINNNDDKNNDEKISDKNLLINENIANDYKEEEENNKYSNKIEDNNKEDKKEESMFFDKDYIVIEKEEDKDSFDENIYNEEKELNKLIYLTFLVNNFETSKTFINQNFENFSIISQNENLLSVLSQFFSLFNFKRPNYEQIGKAKNTVNLYKFLKEEELGQKEENKNIFNLFLRRSNCLSLNLDRNVHVRKYMSKGIFSILDWKIEEIGDVLIYVTKRLLKKIEKKELYRAIYLKKDKEIKSPNVIENIDKFNRLTFFIIEDIISYDHASDRAKVIDKWIQVAEYCKSQKDYNDCIAINSALNSYIITGLNLTNKELKNKTNNMIKSIGKFCSCNGNYKNIREEIKNLNNNKEFYYPYLGMMLRDITFLEESSKYLIEGELINFAKIENVQNLLEINFRFIKKENKTDNKNKIIEELKFFEDLEMNTEENLESIANKIEPKFVFNDGKKEFKRSTMIDEKYFSNYKNPLYLMKSSTALNAFSFGK
jgi:hypothetical protein